MANAIDRFFQFVGNKKPNGCILWTGSTSRGYGHFSVGSRRVKAHRFAFELVHGQIEPGLKVLHNCPEGDNPTCINPSHLFLGTQKANVQDMMAKGRGPDRKGEAHGKAKLTDNDVRQIRQREGRSLASLAEEFGVSKSTVAFILKRQTWNHVQ